MQPGETREDMVNRLNADLEQFIQQRIDKTAKKRENNEEMDLDSLVENIENHPAFMKEVDPSQPLSEEMEGLMKLKYEQEDPTAKAEAYKEDGNYEFKKKRYDIATDNYTEAIKCRCPDKELNAILYTNRAAAQFHRGNYGSSLKDCVMARKFKADHLKAILRGAMCCMEVKRYRDADQWCDAGLIIEPKNEKFLEMKMKADKLHRSQEKDKRKEENKERKQDKEERALMNVIKSRGIKLAGMKESEEGKKLDLLLLTNLESHHPSGAKVHVDQTGVLHWPVLFMYPEYTQMDYIEDFNEQHCFRDHVNHMFGPQAGPASWDEHHKYKPEAIKVYFEDKEREILYNFPQTTTLLQALQHKRLVVEAGTPCFLVIVDKSPFQEHFHKRYKKVVVL